MFVVWDEQNLQFSDAWEHLTLEIEKRKCMKRRENYNWKFVCVYCVNENE